MTSLQHTYLTCGNLWLRNILKRVIEKVILADSKKDKNETLKLNINIIHIF